MEMPPSIPPASEVSRRYSPEPASKKIESWPLDPRRRATSMPSPIHTRLHGLNAHQRLGDEPVELAVPVHVAAEADRHAVSDDLGGAAE